MLSVIRNLPAGTLLQMVGGKLLNTAVRPAVIGAELVIGLDEAESRQTLDSAFEAGVRRPRCAPQ